MRRRIGYTRALAVSVVGALLVGASAADADMVAAATKQKVAAGAESIEFVAELPRYPLVVRDETTADANESVLVSDVILSNQEIFAGGAWTGEEIPRVVYVKAKLSETTSTLLERAKISSSAYRIVDVPLSLSELDGSIREAAAVLRDFDVPFTTLVQ